MVKFLNILNSTLSISLSKAANQTARFYSEFKKSNNPLESHKPNPSKKRISNRQKHSKGLLDHPSKSRQDLLYNSIKVCKQVSYRESIDLCHLAQQKRESL